MSKKHACCRCFRMPIMCALAPMLLSACYLSSPQGRHDPDVPFERDVAPDGAPDAPPDAVEDVPREQQPLLSVFFNVKNVAPPESGELFYFRLHDSIRGYPFEVSRFMDGRWVEGLLDMPECIADCADVEIPNDCNVGCISLPFVPAVLELSPGDSFQRFWDVIFFVMQFDVCQITGCFDLHEAAPGRFRVEICGYTEFECDVEYGCERYDDGVIFNAYPSGEQVCSQFEFDLPEASGSTFYFAFGPEPP